MKLRGGDIINGEIDTSFIQEGGLNGGIIQKNDEKGREMYLIMANLEDTNNHFDL